MIIKQLDRYHSQWIQAFAFRLFQALKERVSGTLRIVESSDDDHIVNQLTYEPGTIRHTIFQLKDYIVRNGADLEMKAEFQATMNWLDVFLCQQYISTAILKNKRYGV